MLEFSSQLVQIGISERKISKSLFTILGQVFREAAREWLRTFIETGVPVETGMAKSAFKPLGRYLRVAVPIRPKRKPYYSVLEGVEQSPASGEEKSDFYITTDANEMVFYWETTILHWFLAEYYNGKAVPGEEIEPIAEEAFLRYMNLQLARRLPIWARDLFEVRPL